MESPGASGTVPLKAEVISARAAAALFSGCVTDFWGSPGASRKDAPPGDGEPSTDARARSAARPMPASPSRPRLLVRGGMEYERLRKLLRNCLGTFSGATCAGVLQQVGFSAGWQAVLRHRHQAHRWRPISQYRQPSPTEHCMRQNTARVFKTNTNEGFISHHRGRSQVSLKKKRWRADGAPARG